jgi:hypothetical protein
MAFVCQRCGACCRWPGTVRVTADECDAIAAALGLPVAEFLARCTRLAPDRASLVLGEAEDGACLFLTPDRSCAIQAAKPRQCRAFPLDWTAGPEEMRQCAGWRAAATAAARQPPETTEGGR